MRDSASVKIIVLLYNRLEQYSLQIILKILSNERSGAKNIKCFLDCQVMRFIYQCDFFKHLNPFHYCERKGNINVSLRIQANMSGFQSLYQLRKSKLI